MTTMEPTFEMMQETTVETSTTAATTTRASTTMETTAMSTTTYQCSESERTRCLNGASCVVDVLLNTTSCVCAPGFTDANCAVG